MKDFDDERQIREDRLFRLRGVTFHIRKSVQQDLVDNYFDGLGDPEVPNTEMRKRMNDLVVAALEDSDADAWMALQTDREDPVMAHEVRKVISYMIEVMLNRPTESPSGSGPTPSSDGTSSTDKSPVLVEAT